MDDAADTVRLAAPARRIVSLSPATTELLFAIGAGDRVVGRTRWCDYPAEALTVPSVGDGLPPNTEAVLAQTPDLVLVYRSPQSAAALARFRAAGIAACSRSKDSMKVRASVKPVCEKCKLIHRHGVVRIICVNPKHKQRQG